MTDLWRRARGILFLMTGLAVPLYAFPVGKVFGKPVDLATLLAGGFVATSLPAALGAMRRRTAIFLAGAVVVPLLVLIPPKPLLFSIRGFGISFAHWMLMILFFLSAFSLEPAQREIRRLVVWSFAAGSLVALFALYQAVGIPRGWPGTGATLVFFQREPLHLFEVGGFIRPTSVFLEPSWLGGYLAWIGALGAAILLSPVRTIGFSAALVALPTAVLAILATVSWGAYLDFAVVLVAIGVASLTRRTHLRRLRIIVLAGSALVILGALSPPGRQALKAITERATVRDSSPARYRNVVEMASVFRSHPARGIGLDQYRGDRWCGWLAIAAEAGLLGPIVLAGAPYLVLRRWRRRRPGGFAAVAIPALVALAVVQQTHTGSFIDLWWWYPLSLAGALSSPPEGEEQRAA